MKLRIFFTPSVPVALLGGLAGVLWWTVSASPWPLDLIFLPFAAFYLLLFAISGWALARLRAIERWETWDRPCRLLVLAPHEDDCVIAAGAIGPRNRSLGGVTRIVYLAPDETPGLAERRTGEARAAWREAGLQDCDLVHLDLLPPLRQRNPARLRAAALALRSIIDEFRPSVIVMPMFEGGHIHHDMVAALIGLIVTPQDRFEVFEAPEYSPCTSLRYTPHRVIALCTRWLFGLVSYCGPPDGIDDRTIVKFRLDPRELDRKRRMLGSFVSQNAASLMATRAYPDRFARWDRTRCRARPFPLRGSYLGFVLAARRLLPAGVVDRLFPVQLGTIGREGELTDWRKELPPDAELGAVTRT
ncbi:PIG-L deacetylase family protein [Reyranella sp.]|jgi:LmbE family N-acetylglucosaminyl deacetylase|uniref:PIG-L deacetylase family protein n=1 Tax=Reyranella sp. TaxID=1929291 RepID=UPI002F9562C5